MFAETFSKLRLLAVVAALVLGSAAGPAAAADQKVLKIGMLGVMRGPAASWGLVNKYSAETTAQMPHHR